MGSESNSDNRMLTRAERQGWNLPEFADQIWENFLEEYASLKQTVKVAFRRLLMMRPARDSSPNDERPDAENPANANNNTSAGDDSNPSDNNTGSVDPSQNERWTKLAKPIMASSVSVGSNSQSKWAKIASALAFATILTALCLNIPYRVANAIRLYLIKFAAIALLGGMLAAIVDGLPAPYAWAAGAVCLIPAVAIMTD
ncbi:uncharacterized protein LOC127810416 [Diospyros lotus]|uniref:uncharacterized protein LOC127810416 n=1 Tax=Diospyros lotus TaxID=55363 RepID=UPI0022594389|nr:uncharacterized protein LOC127810416 [Diospyros lotus]